MKNLWKCIKIVKKLTVVQKVCAAEVSWKVWSPHRSEEVDKLRWPKYFSTSEEDAERREKLTTKSVIYEVTLIDWVERQDVDADGKVFK